MLCTYKKAVQILHRSGVGIMPTDTIYGLVAKASDKKAVERLYKLKYRENKTGTIIAANIDQLIELGVSEEYIKKIENLWPGPLSVILPYDTDLPYLAKGNDYPAVRVTAIKDLKQILLQTGPLLTTSANQPGEPGSTTIKMAQQYFGNKVDFYVDGGDLSDRLPSTIVSIDATGKVKIVRQGAYDFDDQNIG